MPRPQCRRGEVWVIDLSPQTHKEEPGKRGRPALVIQTDILNQAGHPTTMILPGTTDIYEDAGGDGFPLRVRAGKFAKPGEPPRETDLLVDQVRAVSNHRFVGNAPIGRVTEAHLKRVEEALLLLTGR
ncbi:MULTISPECIES: type II toxin-antitoxin system PemK/MazF family toxin [Cupriavidus]